MFSNYNVVSNKTDLMTATRVRSVIEKLSPSQEVKMRVLETKSVSTTFKDGFGTCLSYNRADITMAVAIISAMTTIWYLR